VHPGRGGSVELGSALASLLRQVREFCLLVRLVGLHVVRLDGLG
jgi:hypothetical protein